MNNSDRLRKALDIIALNHSEGKVSNDTLIKACDTYKQKIGFVDDFDYEMIVAKSCFDYINNVSPDEEICKAILPGQTKMIDGVMYMYVATPNAKTQYDWRIVKKGAKSGKTIGRGETLDDTKVKNKQKFVNSLFPKDLSTLTVVKQLGGSTGAKLVQDINGNQYVMKKGTNTSNGHVKSEYLANQLYDALGMRVPDYELYEDDNGEVTLLSKFIPMTRAPKSSDYAEMSKGWIADCVLANWDVYQNDNCLIDSSGRVIRVDNGGCLDYRAQGAKKNFDDDIVKTYKDMIHYNRAVFNNLEDDDIISQIDDIQSRKDDIVGFLEESNNPMADVIARRIDNLTLVKNHINRQKTLNKPNTAPRNLKPSNEMYREFTDDELDDIWKSQSAGSGNGKLFDSDRTVGWKLLSDICKERGFDARPRVVDDKTYWAHIASSKQPQLFRGLTSGGGFTAQNLINMFKHDDTCFYGNYGIYGEGIYAHVNDGKNHGNQKSNYMQSNAYQQAKGHYAGGDDDSILLMSFENDANIANVADLVAEIKKNPPAAGNTKQLQQEADDIKKELDDTVDELSGLTQKTIDGVKSSMHFDDDSVQELQLTIENTNWGEVDEDGKPAYPTWDEFVENGMAVWVEKNGGEAIREHGQITFKLPNSRQAFTLTQRQYEVNAIKQKNSFSVPYSYPVKRFEDWFMREHVFKVDAAIKESVDALGDTVNELQSKISDLRTQHKDKLDEIKKKSCPNPDEGVYQAIYDSVANRGSLEPVGIYAALKGYDAIYQPNGNGLGNGYVAILNRSKLIVKE